MLKEGTNNGTVSSSNNNRSRVCDACRSAACIVYCLADSAYLCSGCDARVHGANRVASRHERVLVCEACEHAPAAFLCKADAASLCSSCDAEIHSANPIASNHHRVPILPTTEPLRREEDHGFIDVRDMSLKQMCNGYEVEEEDEEKFDEAEDEAEAASWLLPNPVNNRDEINDENDRFMMDGEVDEYLDLVDCNSCGDHNQFSSVQYDDHNENQHHRHSYSTVPKNNNKDARDSVVPVQQQAQHFQKCFDFDSSKVGHSYDGSISQTVSISSMDVGVVPESTISDVSISHSKQPTIGTSELYTPISIPSHFTPLDRKARVLRYKEKRKTRKFEKKIRYASRQAYAETRPRIKGRFAKKTDVEAEVDQMLSTILTIEAGYGVVPTF